MADEKEAPEEEVDGEAPEKKSKKGLILIGATLLLVGVGYFGATMGVPAEEPIPQYDGPFVVALSEDNIQVNLSSTERTVYLLMRLNAEFDSYTQGELEGRLEDPLFLAILEDRLLKLSSTKTPEMIASSDAQDAFMVEIRDAIDPICFPVHFGDSENPFAADSKSGAKPGDSTLNATLRGRWYDHTLHIDAPNHTAKLDEGDEVAYIGDEVDLAVTNAEGHFVFLNTTGIKSDFVGDLNVGVKGRLRRILRSYFITQ
jgi:flagellar basal body-associated protein FliL